MFCLFQGTAPRASIDPESQTVGQGSTATLECIVTGNPQPTVTWSRSRGDLRPNHQVLAYPPVMLELVADVLMVLGKL